MAQQFEFQAYETTDRKVRLTIDKITITIDAYEYYDGEHWIADPITAVANFACVGKNYVVENTDGFPTIEAWYQDDLLPKFQMLELLQTIPI